MCVCEVVLLAQRLASTVRSAWITENNDAVKSYRHLGRRAYCDNRRRVTKTLLYLFITRCSQNIGSV